MSQNAMYPTPKRALIVIDVQNDYDGGNLPIEHPPFRDSIANVARAMEAAGEAGVKVITVRHRAPQGAPVFAEGTHGAELHEAVETRRRDHHIEKTLPSAFTGTDLELWLRNNGIDTLTIAGYMTHHCDLSTTLHAAHMGFSVEFLSDATGTLPYENRAGSATAEEIHRVVTVVLHAGFAAVLTTDEWIDCLKTGALPERDNPYASNQRAIAESAAA
ncbi:cysteine hydrolase family protein [Chelativorans salis]|uniref:Cysteine hydrolase n=1 Tax=Chelativorans salis TaxID=2978478 RepID=A0ABT2LWC0_9HYPH|nr:cysteine hydrolase family protein [Chelativorans sp. EGI FJ00035]MCT7378419.1 cysteine hydrolase [Chelativorans sp. EGI FJ00035]